jgi:hypothetical protein
MTVMRFDMRYAPRFTGSSLGYAEAGPAPAPFSN